MKCAYCPYEYPTEVTRENCQTVFQHVRESHTERWAVVRPKDVWVVPSKTEAST